MFPFQYNNPFLQLNLDLNSAQQNAFPSQYLPKAELPTRVPSGYAPDTQSAYNSIPSLLNKRNAPMELNSAPTKFLNQEGFPFPIDVSRIQDLPKNIQMASRSDEMNPHKMLYRSPQDIYGLANKSAQQIPRLNNGLQYPGLDLAQAEAQSYLNEAASQAYLRQLMDPKTLSAQDYTSQLAQQGNEKLLASLYGLQGGMQGNLGLQSLAGLGNLSGLGNLGGLGGLGNYGNMGNLNNPLMAELMNQARNQQLLQQLSQSMGMPMLQSLPEVAKNEQSLRHLGLDLMMLNSGNMMSQLPQMGISQPMVQQNTSPSSTVNKSTAQTLILQRPEQARQDGLIRKDSTHSGKSVNVPVIQPPKEVKEDSKGKGVVLVNFEGKGRREMQEKPREERIPVREEKQMQQERVIKPAETRVQKNEVPSSSSMISAPVVQEPEIIVSKELERGDRRKAKNLQVEQQQIEKVNKNQVNLRPQRRVQTFEEPQEPKQQVEARPGLRNRRNESTSAVPAVVEKMTVEKEEKKVVKTNKVLTKDLSYLEAQKTQCTESEYSDKGISLGEEVKGQGLMSQLYLGNANVNLNMGESLYKTPEEKMEEEKIEQKIVLTRVGTQFQTILPEIEINEDNEDEVKRAPKLAWDPMGVNPKEIANYFKNLHRILGTKVINQEKALKLLCKKNFDVEDVLATVKKNERYYSNFFGNSTCTRELRSRRNIE